MPKFIHIALNITHTEAVHLTRKGQNKIEFLLMHTIIMKFLYLQRRGKDKKKLCLLDEYTVVLFELEIHV